MSKKLTTKQSHQTDDSHDWLGDCAESYIAYLFAKAGFEVFGAGKWKADVVAHDIKTDKWLRIEVKSTNKNKRPNRKSAEKLKKIANILAEVRFDNNKIDVRICKLKDGICGTFVSNPNDKELLELV